MYDTVAASKFVVIQVLRDVSLRRLVLCWRRFEGSYCLQIQGQVGKKGHFFFVEYLEVGCYAGH
jgi:hypothetical protein